METGPDGRPQEDVSWGGHLKRQRVPKRYIDEVLMEYFVVEGDKASAEAFSQESGCQASEKVNSMDDRVAIRTAIVSGKVGEAVKLLNRLDPEILGNNAALRFRVRRQQFFEHVRSGDVDSALALAISELQPITAAQPELLPSLEEAMALLAFPNPARSPLGHLVSVTQRAETAREVNSAMLTAIGHPTESRLPVLLKMLIRSQKRLKTMCKFPEIVDLATAEFSAATT